MVPHTGSMTNCKVELVLAEFLPLVEGPHGPHLIRSVPIEVKSKPVGRVRSKKAAEPLLGGFDDGDGGFSDDSDALSRHVAAAARPPPAPAVTGKRRADEGLPHPRGGAPPPPQASAAPVADPPYDMDDSAAVGGAAGRALLDSLDPGAADYPAPLPSPMLPPMNPSSPTLSVFSFLERPLN